MISGFLLTIAQHPINGRTVFCKYCGFGNADLSYMCINCTFAFPSKNKPVDTGILLLNLNLMMQTSCGIDFGTSNSSIAIAGTDTIRLVPVEDTHLTIPSAIFFPEQVNTPLFGRAASQSFFTKKKGRYMRSLKRILGTSLTKQGTLINSKVITFDTILAMFLKNMKMKAEALAGTQINQVVMGRPVHFIDNNPEADKKAEAELLRIARNTGFTDIAFQFEPIAAAFAHEVKIQYETLALVVDLGGGTSDFTVIRLSGKYVDKKDRSSDILANTGIRVGGNDFDKNLSLAAVMPHLGYKTTYGEKKLEVPLKLYHDLAEWSLINFLYTLKIISQVKQLLNQSHDKKRLSRLATVLEKETGHALLAEVEQAKIALTAQQQYQASLDFIETNLLIDIQRRQFEEAIQEEVDKIEHAATECIRQAMITPHDIQLVILTGGSTEVPLIQTTFKKLFPNAAISDENKLASVGLGLGYDSRNKFG